MEGLIMSFYLNRGLSDILKDKMLDFCQKILQKE